MIIRETHIVPDGVCDVRLSDYVRTAFPVIPSRKGASKAIKRGELSIDGKTAQSGTWVLTGQTIELLDLQRAAPKEYRMPLEVVYEDDFLAVINKPPGIEVSGNKFKTVENALSGSVTMSPLADALDWPRPVHRLDYSTSGLLLVAKTASAQVFLGHQFQERTIHKRYCAVVMGEVQQSGVLTTPINELACESEYAPTRSIPSLQSGHLTLVSLSPVTGRTHQLRIHMASIGHPIVGDQKYGEQGNVLKGKGLFLAAVELRFPHPDTLKEITIYAPVPAKFESLLQREESRWDKFNQAL